VLKYKEAQIGDTVYGLLLIKKAIIINHFEFNCDIINLWGKKYGTYTDKISFRLY